MENKIITKNVVGEYSLITGDTSQSYIISTHDHSAVFHASFFSNTGKTVCVVRYYNVPIYDSTIDMKVSNIYAHESPDRVEILKGVYEYCRSYKPNHDDVFALLEKMMSEKFNVLSTN